MHTRAKISLTFWPIACALAALIVLAIHQQWRYGLEISTVLAGSMLLLVAWRLWAVRQLHRKQEANAWRRLEELQREVILLGRPVPIEGMGPTLVPLLGIVFTVLLTMMYRGTGKVWCLVFAVLTAIVVLIMVAVRVEKLGQPLLIVSREGVQPAGYGLLPWSAVYGIALHTLGSKQASRTVLNVYVPELKAHVASAQWFIRWFRAIPGIRQAKYRDVIMIPMHKPSELPRVIERLCRNVWQQASASSEDLKQVRTEHLKRYAQLADDDLRTLMAWAQVWGVPGSIALALLVVQVPLGRLLGFVPTDTWATQALVIASVLVIVAWGLVITHARKVFGERFTRGRLVQVLVTLGIASLLVVPMTWFLVTDLGGAMAGYGNQTPYEQLTVIATKEERFSRRSCDYVLRHPALGNPVCLVREEFVSFPNQVPVVLSIRRNSLGYTVYEQRVALPGR